ncbi:617_t:CDS:2, partial [Racocetra fulgida]
AKYFQYLMYSDFEEDPIDTLNWSDFLPYHPIFHTNEVEQLENGCQDDIDDGEYLPEWINNVKYVTLDTPYITYNIRSITVNFKEKGTLIAVAGDYEVSVVVMPKSTSVSTCER